MLPESRSQFSQERLHFRFFCGYGTGTEVPDSFVNSFNFHARKSLIHGTGNVVSVEYRILCREGKMASEAEARQ
jgi:hypothetical protein